jgi:hypothetical protein
MPPGRSFDVPSLHHHRAARDRPGAARRVLGHRPAAVDPEGV